MDASHQQQQQHKPAERMSLLGTETAYAISGEAQRLAEEGKKVYPFHIGDLNVPSPAFLTQAMNEAIQKGKTGYCPAPGIMPLRQALAEAVGTERGVTYTADNVSIQSGGKPVIGKFLQAVMNPGDEVLYPSPGYPIYESQIRFHGGVLRPYRYRETRQGFELDLDNLQSLITERTKVLIYNNYQNPVGCSSSPEEMEALAQLAVEHDLLVLSDEAYFHMLYDGHQGRSIVALPGMQERTVILYTFSKSFSMTGWRLGAAIGPRWIIDLITKLNTNDEACTTHFIQWAGIAALGQRGREFTEQLNETLAARRDLLCQALGEVPGFVAHKPMCTFYLFVNVTEAMRLLRLESVEEFRKLVLDKTGVSFCTREHFGAPLEGEQQKYIRFAYSGIGEEDIRQAGRLLKEFMTNQMASLVN